MAHRLCGPGQAVTEQPGDLQQFVGVNARVEELPGELGGLRVGAQEHGSVRIFDPRQTHGTLHPLEQIDIDPRFGGGQPCRDILTVVTDDSPRRQHHWRRGATDLLEAHPTLDQPGDQLGALCPRLPFEPVEQSGCLEIDFVTHLPNVYGARRCDRHER